MTRHGPRTIARVLSLPGKAPDPGWRTLPRGLVHGSDGVSSG